MILPERTTERVAWKEFAARIVRKSAKNLNVQIVFDKIITYVIYAKTLWPEVLTDYQYLRFLWPHYDADEIEGSNDFR
ncbi:hypothetical protein GCM10009712_31970 [Pseudarthrobacter sulfonivorans]